MCVPSLSVVAVVVVVISVVVAATLLLVAAIVVVGLAGMHVGGTKLSAHSSPAHTQLA